MDNFPRPMSCAAEYIQVPYLSGHDFDNQGFEGFAERCGFAKDGVLDVSTRSPDEVASLMQSWLFFGFISEFFGIRVDTAEFIKISRADGTTRLLTTDPLDSIAAKYTKRIRQASSADATGIRDEAMTCMKKALQVSSELDDSITKISDDLCRVALSVKLLLATLFTLCQQSFSKWDVPNKGYLQPRLDRADPSTKLLHQQFLANGWCPSRIERMFARFGFSTLYYLLHIRRHERQGRNHDSCEKYQCKAYSVDMKYYESRHVTARCNCKNVGVPVEDMEDIVRRGRIPIVSIKQESHGSISLQVREAEARTQYVAISHVWADGLGNPHSNALPLCQLQQLDHNLRSLPDASGGQEGTGDLGLLKYNFSRASMSFWPKSATKRSDPYFWMDTLCVPLSKDRQEFPEKESEDLNIKAINQMAAIYAGATQILVLDAELDKLRIGASGAAERLGIILSCAWTGRAWTLQEGAIADSHRFRCIDGSLPVESYSASIRDVIQLSAREIIEISALLPVKILVNQWRGSRKRAKMLKEAGQVPKPPQKTTGDENSSQNFIRDHLERYVFTQLRGAVSNDVFQQWWKDSGNRDILGNASPEFSVRQFVSIWNELVFRSTTKERDIPVIIANLLDFNSFFIMRDEPRSNDPEETKAVEGHAMRAILWSLGEIPLSLLFNDGPRVRSDTFHQNRWIPLRPAGGVISWDCTLKLKESTFILSSHDVVKAENDTQLCLVEELPTKLGSFRLTLSSGKVLRVEFLRQFEDRFEHNNFVESCFVFEKPESGRPGKGACFQISCISEEPALAKPAEKTKVNKSKNSSKGDKSPSLHENEQVTLIDATFDCPVLVYEIDDSEEGNKDTMKSVQGSTPSTWKFRMAADSNGYHGPFARRPFAANPMSFLGLLGLALVIVTIISVLVMVIRIVIGVNAIHARGPTVMDVLGLIFGIAPATAAMTGPFAYFLLIAGIPITIVDETRNGGLSPLVYFWVVAFSLFLISLFVLVPLWLFVLVPKSYRARLETFDEDWQPEKASRGLALIMRFNAWLYKPIDRFGLLD